MPGTPYPLGPFSAGMNNISEEATVDDNQVTLARNLELDFDGSYRTRPAIVADAATPVAGQSITPLGFYVRDDGVIFLVCTTDAKTWIYNVTAKTFTEVWANKASGFVQHDNKVVLCSETVAGGYWEAGVWTATATMPLAANIVFYQFRFWAYGVRGTAFQNRVWFSNITTGSGGSIWNWTTATEWIEVGKGDGEWITALVADVNALMIFRNRSFWRFTYPTSPFKGDLQEQNSTIGADSRWAVVPYESYFLVFSQGTFYQLINYQFYPLNNKRIDFGGGSTGGTARADMRVALSIVGARCLVWFYGATYAYDIITNTWSVWDSPTTYAALFLQIPQAENSNGDNRTALAVSGITENDSIYRLVDDVLPGSAAGEPISAVLRTKTYTFDEAAQYKRMFYWTIEARSSSGVRGIAFPAALPSGQITFDDLETKTFDELELGSFDNPLILVPSYESDVAFPTASPTRVLVKAIQPVRLLRNYFEVYLESDGTARTAPARIFAIVPYVRIKAGVSKKVS